MVIETHMKLCETGPDSSETFFVPKTGKMNSKWAKTEFFEFVEKIWSLIFTELDLQ